LKQNSKKNWNHLAYWVKEKFERNIGVFGGNKQIILKSEKKL
jgi:hypothetical protein